VPLLTAIRANDETAVELLLDAGANPSFPIDVPPLHYAVLCGLSRRSIERLLGALRASPRASVFEREDFPWWNGFEMPSPLLEACAKGNLEALEALISDMQSDETADVSVTRTRAYLNKVRCCQPGKWLKSCTLHNF
jgi:hypothetical protein